ncbi:hypothetical protein AAEU32_05435 [Pseudoalteromonas sp. SSDWG2]|uniref:hypothetical protein n=1 Tax=Pseudoalteromonas sp. SSDWG2 TaxID=3139391 RepID=UPI003BAA4A80
MSNLDNFVALSALLTGFNEDIIAPTLDVDDMKSVYFSLWQAKIDAQHPQLSETILSAFAQLKSQGKSASQIGMSLLDDSRGEPFIFACRALIYLWYMGAWPTVAADNSSTSFTIVSGKAYSKALVWQVMQAHPMGDSDLHYGYWAEAPAALCNYTGNSKDDEGAQS